MRRALPYPTLALTLALLASWLVLPKGALARTAVVSADYGYSPTDATAFVQAALDDVTADTVLLDAAPGTWRTGQLVIRRSGFTLLFEPGTVLEAVPPGSPNELTTFQSLLVLRACRNVVVDGRGGTIQMEKTDYDRSSQFRHGILTRGAISCTIRNLLIRRCAGDGIEVSSDFVVDVDDVDGDGDRTDVEPVVPSRDIAIDDVTCDENNRQGISVIDVVGLAVTNSTFSNTSGTEPASGVDFEPFRTYHRMQDVTFRDCVFSGNDGHGIQFGGVDLDQSSPPSDILIERATVFGNGQDPNPDRTPAAVNVNSFNRDNRESARGTFTVRNTVIRDEPFSGINVRQYASGLDILFDDVLVDNVANTPRNRFAGPITVQPRSYDAGTDTDPCFGNVEFRDVRVRDDQQFFNGEVRQQVTISQLRTDLAGPADVTGDICIETPFPFSVFRAPEPCANVTLAITACTAPVPLDLLSFAGACDDDGGAHVLTWDVADATELLGFTLEASRSGAGEWTTAATVPTADAYARAAFAKTVDGTEPRYYRLVSRFADGGRETSPVVYVGDCGATAVDAGLRVFPNPTRRTLGFEPAATQRTWTVTDAVGRVVRRVIIPAGQTAIDLGGLPRGHYALSEESTARRARIVVE